MTFQSSFSTILFSKSWIPNRWTYPIIDVFSAHYCDQKLFEEAFGLNVWPKQQKQFKYNEDDTQLRESDLLDFLECVQNALDIVILIITYGSPELFV